MKAIAQIKEKYDDDNLRDHIESLDDINQHALVFCKDVANILRLITLQRNLKRNPTGYGLSNAPIIGLLTRIAKLLELLAKVYEIDNGEHIAIFSRPLIEASVVVTYLLKNGDETVEDFRRCSYKDTLRILRDYKKGSEFFQTPGGQRVLHSALQTLDLESLAEDDFAMQKRNRWRLQGKSVYKIFGEGAGETSYPFIYGLMSESIHGSWNESMDWCLTRNSDGTFSRTLYIMV